MRYLKVALLVVVVVGIPVVLAEVDAIQSYVPPGQSAIEQLTDVVQLERAILGGDLEASKFAAKRWDGQGKDVRTAAYARLGQLATPESLAAVARIEAAIIKRAHPAPRVLSAGMWTHPAWHFSDGDGQPIAEVFTSRRKRYAVVISGSLGATDFFLMSSNTPHDGAVWSRPVLTPVRWYPGLVDPKLKWEPPNLLRLSYRQRQAPPPAIMDGIRDRAPAPTLGDLSFDLDTAAIERDADRDGWTDLEEARLGLNPSLADTDGDGIPDGRDSCPGYAPKSQTEDQEIVARALFAVYSVGGSRTALLVQDGVAPVQVVGYSGPILFNINRTDWIKRFGHGGVFLRWRAIRRTETEATVNVLDWEGMLAGGSQAVSLRKIDGKWIVVARVTLSVS
jgi:hypothetical protein